MGDHIHSFNSMAIAKKNALGRPNHPIEHYRKSFGYLAHGPGSVEERIKNFRDNPEFQLAYFGDSAASEIVGYLFADKFVIYNDRDKFALELLGISPPFSKGDDFVTRLKNFNQAIQPVIEGYKQIVGKRTAFPLNLEIDQFFSYLYETYREDEVEDDDVPEQTSDKVNYWMIAPGEGAYLWNQWQEEGIVAIGWDDLGDLNHYKDKSEIRARLQKLSSEPESSKKNNTATCYNFAKVMKPGDIVFAKKGRKLVLGWGFVDSDYLFDAKRKEYKNIRKMKWQKIGDWVLPQDSHVAVKTLTCITPYPAFVKSLKSLVGFSEALPPAATQHWWLNANPNIWNFRDLPVGQRETYTAFNKKGNKRRIYKYFEEAKAGDLVLGYVSTPDREMVAVCRITKGLHDSKNGPQIEFEKLESLVNPVSYNELQRVPELKQAEPFQNHQGSLFRLKDTEYQVIRRVIDERNPPIKPSPKETFSPEDALSEVFLTAEEFESLLAMLRHKKNIILQGPPGVGKTFTARLLAYAFLRVKDKDRVSLVQFHQSYSYEDFIQGYRPTEDGRFELKNGLFFEFCKRAQRDPYNDYVFIIDEINRGNLSKIFGELMMLIESDKRGSEFAIPLTYARTDDEEFFIPENLYFIGTMNTADRSLAMVDYALRRRFSFVTLPPQFDNRKFQESLVKRRAANELVQKIVTRMNALNKLIADDKKNLGLGYRIGHSFFCPPVTEQQLDESWYTKVIRSEIIPLLEEYWFDDEDRVKKAAEDLLR
jgi:5-methylcytosine-specific restriction protein B